MAKIYGITKTFFIEWGIYKWARKYEKCIVCGTCNFKFKWKWYCVSCWDKKRWRTQKRKESKKKSQKKYALNNEKLLKYKKNWEKEDYKQNREAKCLLAKIYRMRKKWIKLLQININWKIRYLPYESMIEKPNNWQPDYWNNYDIRKQQQKDFMILKKYYEKKAIRKTLH